MEKKYFNQPSLKVVRMNNDIIATSLTNEKGDGTILVGGRRDVFDDSYDEF